MTGFTAVHSTAKIILTNDAKNLPLGLKATFTSGGGYLYQGSKPSGDGTVSAYRVPRNKKINLFLLDSTGKVVAQKNNFDWCAQPGSSVTIDYVAPVAQKPVPVTVSVTEYCAQNQSVTNSVPSSQTSVTAGAFFASGSTDVNGSYTYNLIPGNYNFSAYDRTTGSYSVQSNVAISAARTIAFRNPIQCKPITGTTGATGSTGTSLN